MRSTKINIRHIRLEKIKQIPYDMVSSKLVFIRATPNHVNSVCLGSDYFIPVLVSPEEQERDLTPNEDHILFIRKNGDKEMALYTGSSYGLNYKKTNGETGTYRLSQCSKVLALPEQLPDEFIKMIINKQINELDDVLLNCEPSMDGFQIKLNHKNQVSTYKKKQ